MQYEYVLDELRKDLEENNLLNHLKDLNALWDSLSIWQKYKLLIVMIGQQRVSRKRGIREAIQKLETMKNF